MCQDYNQATWTLSVELFASYWIFLLAFVAIHYRGRYWLYVLILTFLYVPRITDAYHYTNFGFQSMHSVPKNRLFDTAIRQNMPLFFIGVMFCDLEHDPKIRRLDTLRNLPWYFKVPVNISLIILFFFYASVEEEQNDHLRSDDYRTYDIAATNDYLIGHPVCMLIAGLSIFILALISQSFQWILATPPF